MMLRISLRWSITAVALFACLLAALVVATREEALPLQRADAVVHLDTGKSAHDKASLLASLSQQCDADGIELYRLSPDPSDFYRGRFLYRMSAHAVATTSVQNFSPGRHTVIKAVAELGQTPLSGPYLLVDSARHRAGLEAWAQQQGVDADVTEVSPLAVARQAFVSTGGWLPTLTAVSVLCAALLAWYVLRARARSLKVLQGAPTWRILSEDAVQAVRTVALPVIVVLVVPPVALLLSGRAAFTPSYLAVLCAIGGAFLLVAVGWAAFLSRVSWPSLATIANRQPPERGYQWVGELVKVGALLLVMTMLPALGGGLAAGLERARTGSQWYSLNEYVRIRNSFGSEAAMEAGEGKVHGLALDAQRQGRLALSFTMEPGPAHDWGGFDRFVLVDEAYLALVGPSLGLGGTAPSPLGPGARRVGPDDLAPDLRTFLRAQLDLLSQEPGALDDGRGATHWAPQDGTPLTFLGPDPSRFDQPTRPLVVVVRQPAEVLRPSTITSLVSSGNILFLGGTWLDESVSEHGLSPHVLSMDRASDAGLAASQAERTKAVLQGAAVALVALAVAIGTTVSAMAWALGQRRALAVRWASGASWWDMLRRRAAWEVLILTLVAVPAAFLAAKQGPFPLGWVVGGAAGYLLLTWGLHRHTTRAIIRVALARRA